MEGVVVKTEDFYKELYSDKRFQTVYQKERLHHYKKMMTICQELKVKSLLDIGCSYGFFVEFCNHVGINAYGLDFAIEKLKQGHQQLEKSKGKFIYGSIDDDEVIQALRVKKYDALVMMDTLRYIYHPKALLSLDTKFIIVKEISNNRFIKKNSDPIVQRLYSPIQCMELFEKTCHIIYPSKYLFKIYKPHNILLKTINAISPTYTIILVQPA
jgi:SAM-dependent methyltransferase